MSAVCEKRHAAAAHDALVLWKKGAQLMLSENGRTADAHGAGRGCIL